MRIAGAYLLMVSLVVQMVSSSLIVLNYHLNTAYIIENFCVNKDRPELKCNGKCHLKKQVQADEERRSDAPIERTELMVLVFTVDDMHTVNFLTYNSSLTEHDTPYRFGCYAVGVSPDLRPPQV